MYSEVGVFGTTECQYFRMVESAAVRAQSQKHIGNLGWAQLIITNRFSVSDAMALARP